MRKKYYKFELNMVTMNILAILLFIVGVIPLSILGIEIDFSNYTFGFIGLLVFFILHELCHGLGYSLFAKNKKNIKYGIVLEKGVLYAMCQERISKTGILISLILPLVILTLITLPIGLIFNLGWLTFYSIMNLSGAVGDIAMFFLIMKMPKDVEYIDYDNSIGAYLLSNADLSKYKVLGMHFVESGNHSEKLINKDINHIYVSKSSKYFIIFIAVIVLINLILNMI